MNRLRYTLSPHEGSLSFSDQYGRLYRVQVMRAGVWVHDTTEQEVTLDLLGAHEADVRTDKDVQASTPETDTP